MKTRKLEDVLYEMSWIAFAALAVLGWVYQKTGIRLPCVLDAFFGIYCPGCGGTRAVMALAHGKLLLSLWYHPLVLYTAVIWGGFMLTQTAERAQNHALRIRAVRAGERAADCERRGKRRPGMIRGWRFHDWYLYGALVLLLGNCVMKNILRLCFRISM